MSNVAPFLLQLAQDGQTARFHREEHANLVECPCRTPEGYRWAKWHVDNPPGTPNAALAGPPFNGINPPVCNEEGFTTVLGGGEAQDVTVRAFIQPIQSTRATRLSREILDVMFGEVQQDDHLGIFPLEWGGEALNFYGWSSSGEDYIVFDNRRFIVVNANKIPDPSGGLFHHWEVALRLVKDESERPGV